MVDRELNEMSDEQLRSARPARLTRWPSTRGTILDGERMVAESHAYDSSRSKAHADAFKRMLNQTMDLWYYPQECRKVAR